MAEVIVEQPKARIEDHLILDKLAAVKKYQISQGNVPLEAVTGGAWANMYVISDMSRKV